MGPASPGDPGYPDGPWRQKFFIKVKRHGSFSQNKTTYMSTRTV